jgi:hypothetical protein
VEQHQVQEQGECACFVAYFEQLLFADYFEFRARLCVRRKLCCQAAEVSTAVVKAPRQRC